MKSLLLIILIGLTGCVTIPIPPAGEHKGALGSVKVSVSVSYTPKTSPESPKTNSQVYAWEQFKLSKPKLFKDK